MLSLCGVAGGQSSAGVLLVASGDASDGWSGVIGTMASGLLTLCGCLPCKRQYQSVHGHTQRHPKF